MKQTTVALSASLAVSLVAVVAQAEPPPSALEAVVANVEVTDGKQSRRIEQHVVALVAGGRAGEVVVDTAGTARSRLKLWATTREARTLLAFEYERTNVDRSRCTAHGEVLLGGAGEKRIGARLPCGGIEDLVLTLWPGSPKK